MNESVVQIGGAVRHRPLPSLINFVHNNNDSDDNTSENLDSNVSKDILKASIGGFIGEGQLAWRAVGSSIEVIDTQTCIRQAAWTFGAILHNASAVVTCVCGIGIGPVTHIVVGVDLGADQSPRGMVGVLSLRRSRIIRAFTFHQKVTNVCMITGGEKIVDSSTLANELRSCQGLLTVATSHASLYLVDLGLDLGDEITSDEMSPASLVEMCVPDPEADVRRNKAISKHYHPILCLSDNMNTGKTFTLLGPDDNILYEAPRSNVNISSILYIPQIASLIVGYSFGSFQIINLNLITIDCASPYEENLPPVFSFAYQEPENDPRSFVYLWVCRSINSENNSNSFSNYSLLRNTCSLYAMNYEKKEWIEGHGLWYQNLVSISPRFDFQTVGGIGEKVSSPTPSKMISAMTVVGTTPAANLSSPFNNLLTDALLSSEEDSEPVPELSLCIFCWEVNVLSHGKIVTQHYIAIFDINQWYQSHMPSSLRLEENILCPYMSFHILDKVPKSVDETILGGIPQRGSWSRHSSRMHCEKIWFPSALSYEFNLLTSEGLATYRCPSVQQSAISSLVQQGPGAVVNPHPAYEMCLFSGILSSFDGNSSAGILSTVSEREHILNTALEYHLLSLLVQCCVEFSEGRFSHMGCSSQLLLDWAWKRLKAIKNSSDAIFEHLFGHPTDVLEPLSAQNLTTLHQNLTYLTHLSTVITSIRDNAKEVTNISAGELEGRVQVVNLLQLHLQVTLWFYHCGLLPEYNAEEATDESSVPFPAELLRTIYNQRRNDIKKFSSVSDCEILLIDSIIEDCGQYLSEIWDNELGGGENLYPPSSLHSFLSMYLCPSISTSTKHRIVQYLFLDLASLFSDNYSNVLEELVKFPSSFSLSPSLIKLTQAFWQIDHKDFQAGLSALLDPLVNPSDITLSQHRKIIKSFLYQGEVSLALTYAQKRQPPKSELEDIRMTLSLMLANGRVREAFHYQRKQRVSANTKELLYHMFEGCQELRRLESVVHLPLSPIEEEHFVSYLRESKNPSAQDLLLVYYLQQSRYSEISSFHDPTFKNNKVVHKHQKHETRSAIVQGYLSHLPDIRNQMTKPVKSRPTRTIYSKPRPLSARIRQSSVFSQTPKSRASIFRSSLDPKIEDRKSRFTPYTPFRSKAQRRLAIQTWTEEIGLEKSKTQDEISMDLTRIVFPTNSNTHIDHTPTTTKSSRAVGAPVERKEKNRDDVSQVMEKILRKSIGNTSLNTDKNPNMSFENLKLSEDIVALLKTPPVKRTSFSTKVNNSLIETPQSILKVRKILEESQSVSETVSSVLSFPLHRISSKSSQDNTTSNEKLDGAIEAGSLTPKQLRFDLPHVGKFTSEEKKEQQVTPSRKRKRSGSPSSSETPTPRKPMPRYSLEYKNVGMKLGSSVTKHEEDEFVIKSTVVQKNLNKTSEERRLHTKTEHHSKTILLGSNSGALPPPTRNYLNQEVKQNSSTSFQEDSFHSVEDYENDHIDLSRDNSVNYDENSSLSSSSENLLSCSKQLSEETEELTNESKSQFSRESKVKLSEEQVNESEEISNDKEQNSFKGEGNDLPQSDKYLLSSTNTDKIDTFTSESNLTNYLSSTNKNEFRGTIRNVNNDNKEIEKYAEINESFLIQKKDKREEIVDSSGLEESDSENDKLEICNKFSDERTSSSEVPSCNDSSEPCEKAEGHKIETDNSCEVKSSQGELSTDLLPQGVENDPHSVNELRESDLEEEKRNIFNEEEYYELKTLSKKDTNEMNEEKLSDSLSRAATVIIETHSEGNTLNNFSEASIQTKSVMGNLPSDLENLSTFYMTSNEREIVDKIIDEGRSSVLQKLNSSIEEEENEELESPVPVLEFSVNEDSDHTALTHSPLSNKEIIERENYDSHSENSEVSEKLVKDVTPEMIDEEEPLSLQLNLSVTEEENNILETAVPVLEYSVTEDSDNKDLTLTHLSDEASKEKQSSESRPESSEEITEKLVKDVTPVQLESDKLTVIDSKVENVNDSKLERVLSSERIDKQIENVETIQNVSVQPTTTMENNDKNSYEVLNHVIEEHKVSQIMEKEEVNIQEENNANEINCMTEVDESDNISGHKDDVQKCPIVAQELALSINHGNEEGKPIQSSEAKETAMDEEVRKDEENDQLTQTHLEEDKTSVLPSIQDTLFHDSHSINNYNDNNNIPKELPEKKEVKSNTPSRGSILLKRLDTDAIIKEDVAPSTPIRRSRRLSGSTPSKSVTSSSKQKRGFETPKKDQTNSSKNLNGYLVDEKDKIESIEVPEELNIQEKEVIQKTPVQELKNIDDNIEDSAAVAKKAHKENSTPRRRSARLSGSKEVLGNIFSSEDKLYNSTPKKSTPKKTTPSKRTLKKETPPRARRKSGTQNVTVIEPVLETIEEDTELSAAEDKKVRIPLELTSTTQERLQPQLITPTNTRRRSLSETILPSNELITGQPTLPSSITPRTRSRRRAASESEADVGLKTESDRYSDEHGTVERRPRTRHSSGAAKTRNSVDKSVTEEQSDIAFMSPLEDKGTTLSLEKRFKFTFSKSRRSSSWGKSLQSISIPEGFETFGSPSPSPSPQPENTDVNEDVFVSEQVNTTDANKEVEGENGEIEEPSPFLNYQFLETGDLPSRKSQPKTWRRSRMSFRRQITSLKSIEESGRSEDGDSENKRPKKKVKKVSAKKDENEAQKEKVEEEEKELKGFSFQNPEEIISVSQAVSDVFKKLTEEHDKIVSENFIFSPPLSLSGRRRKTKERRKPRNK